MAATSPASRLVASAARERLRPLGLNRRGRSRIWVDDHTWWLGIVEFPSPTWSQGSGLTVGVMWLWQDLGHLAFDFTEQVQPRQDFRNEMQFGTVAAALADQAGERVETHRSMFGGLDQAAERLLERPVRRGFLWESFNAGVAAALVGRPEEARDRLHAVLAEEPMAPWVLEVQRAARHVYDVAHDLAAVGDWAVAAVASCRRKLELEPTQWTVASVT
ncbi:hypothetical protein AB0O22_16975 [Streptomyces sp. NPDC091204]|uniref:hypothetical protein n=1 Tax=Streptomyces sp. NPDC091204 TaxID=3155299 RepID=UPI0034341F63